MYTYRSTATVFTNAIGTFLLNDYVVLMHVGIRIVISMLSQTWPLLC